MNLMAHGRVCRRPPIRSSMTVVWLVFARLYRLYMNSNFRVDTIAPNTTGNYNVCKTAFAIFYILVLRPVWVRTGGRNRIQFYERTARVKFMLRLLSVGNTLASLQSRQQGNENQCVQRTHREVMSVFNPPTTSKACVRTAERAESRSAINMGKLEHWPSQLFSS